MPKKKSIPKGLKNSKPRKPCGPKVKRGPGGRHSAESRAKAGRTIHENHLIRKVKTVGEPNPEGQDYHVNTEGWVRPRFEREWNDA